MGQFSYDCDKCGAHDQFDWIDDCVVEVGGKLVLGRYDGYGGVEIDIESDDESTELSSSPSSSSGKKEEKGNKGDGEEAGKEKPSKKRSRVETINAYHQQFKQYFDSWGIDKKDVKRPEALFATKIYCAGEGSSSPQSSPKKNPYSSMMSMMNRERAFMLGMGQDPDDYEDRCCVPKGSPVLVSLTLEDVVSIQKTHEL